MHEGYTEQYTERTTQRTGTNLNTCKLQPELRLSEDSSAWVGGWASGQNELSRHRGTSHLLCDVDLPLSCPRINQATNAIRMAATGASNNLQIETFKARKDARRIYSNPIVPQMRRARPSVAK